MRSESLSEGKQLVKKDVLHSHVNLTLAAEDPHPIMGHGESVSSPAKKKVKVSFQATVQR